MHGYHPQISFYFNLTIKFEGQILSNIFMMKKIRRDWGS